MSTSALVKIKYTLFAGELEDGSGAGIVQEDEVILAPKPSEFNYLSVTSHMD